MTEIETEALKFTDAAARKVGDLIRGEGNPNLKLRVFVQGGGCSGMQYGFEFDEQEQEGDTCVENLGVKLLIDLRDAGHSGPAGACKTSPARRSTTVRASMARSS